MMKIIMLNMILRGENEMNTRRGVILAFMLLGMIQLLGNSYFLSRFIKDRQNNNEAPSAASASKKNHNDETPTLDFAIIGFAKTGTTFLHDILANHSQVIMYDDEFWGDGEALRSWLNETVIVQKTNNSWLDDETKRKEEPQPATRRGIKCPRIVKETARLDQILVNTSRVIVGVRHPVLWFESLYNYRIWQKYQKKRFNRVPPIKYLHTNRTEWLGLSTGAARFDLYLKQLGKVPVSADELQKMTRMNKVDGVMNSTIHHEQHPMKVFLYTMEQIKDNNTQRLLHFQHTLQQFLDLDTPLLQDLASEEKVNVNDFEHSEIINICDEQYRDLRNTLVWQGKHASEWIRSKFMKSKDVIVSDVVFMNEVLERWGDDPCEKTVMNSSEVLRQSKK
jgi:hypothetical protein